MADVITLTYDISPDDFTRAGEASIDVKSKLKQMGVPPEAIRITFDRPDETHRSITIERGPAL